MAVPPGCKECTYTCEPRQSQSDKNPGRWFWSCPHRCDVWQGWLTVSEVEDLEDEYNGEHRCKVCQDVCTPRQSQTPKNPGRWFWSCPNRCEAWQGWLTATEVDEEGLDSPASTKKKGPAKEKGKPTKKKKSTAPVLGGETPAYHCVKCQKELDLEHEVNNHVRRYQHSGFWYAGAPDVRHSIHVELTEAFEGGDYTCEKCLGNEGR